MKAGCIAMFLVFVAVAGADWKIVPGAVSGWRIVQERAGSPLVAPDCSGFASQDKPSERASKEAARIERIRQQDQIRQRRLTRLQLRYAVFETRRHNRTAHPAQRIVCYRY